MSVIVFLSLHKKKPEDEISKEPSKEQSVLEQNKEKYSKHIRFYNRILNIDKGLLYYFEDAGMERTIDRSQSEDIELNIPIDQEFINKLKTLEESNDKKDDLDKEEVLENTQTYSESVKEILDNGKETLDTQKQEISKYERIINYFKIPKNQKEFGIPDDYIRGFKLKIAEVKIAKNMMNYGIENAVKYYLDNVSTKDVSYEDVYFNEQSELALYLAVAQMLSVADDNVVSKYRKEFENTRVIKLLDEVLENERKKEKEKAGKTQNKNHIKS